MAHRVYMHYMLRADRWNCQFLLDDLKTPLPRKFSFTSSDKVIEMAKRGGGIRTQEDRQGMDYGIRQGRGAVWLNLTDEQLAKLR